MHRAMSYAAYAVACVHEFCALLQGSRSADGNIAFAATLHARTRIRYNRF